MKTKLEVEFKWAVTSRSDFVRFLTTAKQLRAKIGAPTDCKIHDRYLDTNDGILTKANIKYRLRQLSTKWELTWKTPTSFTHGLAKRWEKTVTLPKKLSWQQALRLAKTGFVQQTLRKKRWVILFEIKNSRTNYSLQLPKRFKAEVSFDRVLICRGTQTVVMQEIELEFLKGNFFAFKQFGNNLTRNAHLKHAKKSKVATAVSTFGLQHSGKLPKSEARELLSQIFK